MNKHGDRIPVDSGEKQNETNTWIKKKMVLKLELGSKLNWKVVETY